MKRNRRNPAAREYFRAFYEKNHICFSMAMALHTIAVGVNLAISWVLGAVIDAIGNGNMDELFNVLWIMLVITVGMVLVDISGYGAKFHFIRRALVQYKALAFRRLSSKSISAFSKENSGRYLSTLTNDVTSIEANYLEKPLDLAAYGILGIGSLGMMVWYSPLLAVIAIVLSLLPMAAAVLTGGIMEKRELAVSNQNERFMAQIKELLEGFSVIKSFKAEKETGRRFNELNQTVEETKYRRRWCGALIQEASGVCAIVMQFGLFFAGAVLAIQGSISAGTVVVFVNLSGYLTSVIRMIPEYWAARKAAVGLVEKLAEVTEENAGRSGDAVRPEVRDAITLQNVTFGYEAEEPVLKNLSLKIESGKKYALVGASGSGKSTLLNLLMGGYDGYSGSIAIDGKELREIDTDSLYDVMSFLY